MSVEPLKDDDLFPFGKWKGKRMDKVPASYLDWLADQDWIGSWPRVLAYIEANRKLIDDELEEQGLT